MADAFCTEGETDSHRSDINRDKVADPAPEGVYQTERHGNFVYSFPNLEPNREYMVRLHFCELHVDRAGKRILNVRCNGADILKDQDMDMATLC